MSLAKSHILRGKRLFAEVFSTGVRQSRGPLLLIAMPNSLNHHRLGISTPKRLGPAVRRNRVRRQLREAFRMIQQDLPAHYDLLLITRPHGPASLSDYRQLLSELMRGVHLAGERRFRL